MTPVNDAQPSTAAREGQTFRGRSVLLRHANLVRLPHTIFALPFALVGVVLASYVAPITLGDVIWVYMGPPALQPPGGADKQRAEMAKKLFVGNLAYTVTEDELRELFAQAGTCESVSIVTDRDTGQSRGFGFVTMASAEDAERAKKQLDGTDLNGRRLRIDDAADQSTRPRGGAPRGPRR